MPDAAYDHIPNADPGSTLPVGWQYGAMYEVFVRAFQDSDGDGIGDLRGLIARLDYLRDLGITGLWLMPIFPSQDRDHGYAVTNYRDVAPEFGTLADLDALIAAAHERGIGIILDYVMNHSAAQHPAFRNARSNAESEFRDWYLWSATKPEGWRIYGGDPWHADASGFYFGAFWDQMPDFNLRNPDVIAWHHDNLRFWLNRGIDGFRFDAVGNLIENSASEYANQRESYAIVAGLEALIDTYDNRYMVCEAPSDPIGFANAHPGGSAFAFGHQYDLIQAARGDARALELVAGFPPVAPPSIATLLSNHDAFAGARVWDQLDGNLEAMKLAAAMYLLQPGVPFVYYGEEIGMAGGRDMTPDISLRTPMSWTAEGDRPDFTDGVAFRAASPNKRWSNVALLRADPDSLLHFYKAMIGLRRMRPSLARGGYQVVHIGGTTLGFVRRLDGDETVVAINVGREAAVVTVTGLVPGASYDALYPSWWQPLIIDGTGAQSIVLRPQTLAVFGRTSGPRLHSLVIA
jgi:alpha-amylase